MDVSGAGATDAPPEALVDDAPPEALVDADACPAPLVEDAEIQPYETFVDEMLGLPPSPDTLLVIRVSPAFEAERALSLYRGLDGNYVLRSIRLTDNVWMKMMQEMAAQQGSVISLDPACQAAALARVKVGRIVRERHVDSSTARLLLELWQAVLGRAQVVQEVGIHTAKLDGVRYHVWHGGKKAASLHSPRSASVLGQAVSGVERLQRLVESPSADDRDELSAARRDVQSALERTRRQEPCLRPYREEE